MRSTILVAMMAAAALVLCGCGEDDGDDGGVGATGAAGATAGTGGGATASGTGTGGGQATGGMTSGTSGEMGTSNGQTTGDPDPWEHVGEPCPELGFHACPGELFCVYPGTSEELVCRRLCEWDGDCRPPQACTEKTDDGFGMCSANGL